MPSAVDPMPPAVTSVPAAADEDSMFDFQPYEITGGTDRAAAIKRVLVARIQNYLFAQSSIGWIRVSQGIPVQMYDAAVCKPVFAASLRRRV